MLVVVVVAMLIQSRPALASDPTGHGRIKVEHHLYDAGITTVRDPNGITFAERLQGSLYVPKRPGRYPVVVLVHGRHGTCEYGGSFEFFGWPCPDAPPAARDVPSYLGYEYLAERLASHGAIVASISANGINSYDIALLGTDNGMNMRAEIVARHLDLFSTWNDSENEHVGEALVGKVDFDRIGLMGHSRGGEGVARFVNYNRTRTDGPTYPGLRAVFGVAPTDFYDQEVGGVHYGTLLPLCDGDVFDLQGARTFDRARFLEPARFARVQFTLTGANHNWFNTIWTRDDGAMSGDGQRPNPTCDPDNVETTVRLTEPQQREIGAALITSFFLRYLLGDRSQDPLITGARSLPRSLCPDVPIPCRRVLGTSYVGPKRDHRMLLVARTEDVGIAGAVEVSLCKPDTNGGGCPTAPTRSLAEQLTVSWSGRGKVTIPARLDASRFRSLTFRGAMNFEDAANEKLDEQDFDVTLVDSSGRKASFKIARASEAFARPPGSNQQLTLNGVSLALRNTKGLDLSRLARIELVFRDRTERGSIQLLEVGLLR